MDTLEQKSAPEEEKLLLAVKNSDLATVQSLLINGTKIQDAAFCEAIIQFQEWRTKEKRFYTGHYKSKRILYLLMAYGANIYAGNDFLFRIISSYGYGTCLYLFAVSTKIKIIQRLLGVKPYKTDI